MFCHGARTWRGLGNDEGPLAGALQLVYQVLCGGATQNRTVDLILIRAIVLIRVEHVAPLVSPAYDDGSTEHEVEQRSLKLYGLRRARP